jgi:hypothetical protein
VCFIWNLVLSGKRVEVGRGSTTLDRSWKGKQSFGNKRWKMQIENLQFLMRSIVDRGLSLICDDRLFGRFIYIRLLFSMIVSLFSFCNKGERNALFLVLVNCLMCMVVCWNCSVS